MRVPGDAERERDERIDAFREIVRDDPGDAMVHFSLGQALLGAGRYEEAADAFARVIALSPRYSAAYRGLGRSYEGLDRRDEAARAYTRGIDVACDTGDLQAKKEMEIFLGRLAKKTPPPPEGGGGTG